MSDIRTDLTRQFEMAAGTTTGAMHRRLDKNNQDAYGIIQMPNMLLGIVSDGASKGFMGPMGDWTHSEVGAQLSTRWLLSLVQIYCTKFLQRPHLLLSLIHICRIRQISLSVIACGVALVNPSFIALAIRSILWNFPSTIKSLL